MNLTELKEKHESDLKMFELKRAINYNLYIDLRSYITENINKNEHDRLLFTNRIFETLSIHKDRNSRLTEGRINEIVSKH